MLKGEHVILRAIQREDLRPLYDLAQQNVDLDIMAGGDWYPNSFAKREKRFDKHLEDDETHWFVIELDGKIIGDIGLHHVDRNSNCTSFGVAILDPEAVGKGYGRDAIRVLLDYAFRIHSFRRVWLETGGNNPRAQAAYRACGFIEEGRLRQHQYSNGEYEDIIVMGLLRTEWAAQKAQA